MARRQMKIKLLPNGQIEMKTEGIKGKGCVNYIKVLEELTDSTVIAQEYTSEYYEQDYEMNPQTIENQNQ